MFSELRVIFHECILVGSAVSPSLWPLPLFLSIEDNLTSSEGGAVMPAPPVITNYYRLSLY